MSATSNDKSNTVQPSNPRTEKWILWNLDKFGRNFDQYGKAIDERHWIERFQGRIWWTALTWMLRLMKHEHASEPTPFQRWVFYFGAAIISSIPGFLAILALTWVIGLSGIWTSIASLARNPVEFYIAFLLLLLAGGVAYLLRRRFRSYYGGAELMFSTLSIWTGLAEMTSADPNSVKVLVGIFGGLYVMVRALDNIEQGWAEAGRTYAETMRRPTKSEVDVPLDGNH